MEETKNVLLCKIEPMNLYRGITINDPIQNEVPKDRHIGEQYNFMPVESDGKLICRGYFEYHERNVNLKNIGKCNSDEIENVLVIFLSYIKKKGNQKGTLQIVGWYENATVFQKLKKEPDWHYITADARNCILLPTDIRKKWGDYKDIIKFGHHWVKYPNAPQNKEILSGIVSQIIEKINNYSGDNWIDIPLKQSRQIQINKKEKENV